MTIAMGPPPGLDSETLNTETPPPKNPSPPPPPQSSKSPIALAAPPAAQSATTNPTLASTAMGPPPVLDSETLNTEPAERSLSSATMKLPMGSPPLKNPSPPPLPQSSNSKQQSHGGAATPRVRSASSTSATSKRRPLTEMASSSTYVRPVQSPATPISGSTSAAAPISDDDGGFDKYAYIPGVGFPIRIPPTPTCRRLHYASPSAAAPPQAHSPPQSSNSKQQSHDGAATPRARSAASTSAPSKRRPLTEMAASSPYVRPVRSPATPIFGSTFAAAPISDDDDGGFDRDAYIPGVGFPIRIPPTRTRRRLHYATPSAAAHAPPQSSNSKQQSHGGAATPCARSAASTSDPPKRWPLTEMAASSSYVLPVRSPAAPIFGSTSAAAPITDDDDGGFDKDAYIPGVGFPIRIPPTPTRRPLHYASPSVAASPLAHAPPESSNSKQQSHGRAATPCERSAASTSAPSKRRPLTEMAASSAYVRPVRSPATPTFGSTSAAAPISDDDDGGFDKDAYIPGVGFPIPISPTPSLRRLHYASTAAAAAAPPQAHAPPQSSNSKHCPTDAPLPPAAAPPQPDAANSDSDSEGGLDWADMFDCFH